MQVVIIFGPPAVGKMTVGQELQKLTGLKLFHNHMSLELVKQFFDFGTPPFEDLDKKIRFLIFEAIAKSKLKGLIFTMVWDFDYAEDEQYVDEIISIFKKRDAKICLVELCADFTERLKRNKHEHRLKHKPSKRELSASEQTLRHFEKEYRMISHENEFEDKDLFKIDNTLLNPTQAAELIKHHFHL